MEFISLLPSESSAEYRMFSAVQPVTVLFPELVSCFTHRSFLIYVIYINKNRMGDSE